MTDHPTTAFDALRAALAEMIRIGSTDAHYEAQRLEQALSRAGYVIVPASMEHEIGPSDVCIGRHVLIIDGLDTQQASDAAGALRRYELHTGKREIA